MESIEIDDLLSRYGFYNNYVFDAQQHTELDNTPILNREALQHIGENTIKHMPKIFAKYSNRGTIRQADDLMMIVPDSLNDPHFRELKPIQLTGGKLSTCFMLFWKSDINHEEINTFLDLLFHATAI